MTKNAINIAYSQELQPNRSFFPNVYFSAKIHIVIAFFGSLESQLGVDIARTSQFQNRLASSKVVLVDRYIIFRIFGRKVQ
jgi:hypothetical protein